MDQLYDELKRFIPQLRSFNETTAKNWDELQRAWQSAAELWNNDATRRQFENDWSEMGDALRVYSQQHGDAYVRFLERRREALRNYFGY